MAEAKKQNHKKIKVNLALQGGGAHGAFTWGVLDRLLEEPTIEFEGVSGASAGAMNASVFASGMTKGGPKGAQKELHQFWEELSKETGAFNPYHTMQHTFKSEALKWHPVAMWLDMMSQVLAPIQFNPLNYNPLRQIIRDNVDFETLRKKCKLKVFVNATNVETNKLKIFTKEELCEDALLASACLPTVFQPIKYEGEYYWDGGYMGNPILEPLVFNCTSKEIIVVPINGINRKDAPKTAPEIHDRINEITFNSSLLREIRTIFTMKEFSEETSTFNPYVGIHLHSIYDDKFMENIGVENKFDTDWVFLQELKEMGRAAAAKWVKKHLPDLGRKTTLDIARWSVETPSTTCLRFPKKK